MKQIGIHACVYRICVVDPLNHPLSVSSDPDYILIPVVHHIKNGRSYTCVFYRFSSTRYFQHTFRFKSNKYITMAIGTYVGDNIASHDLIR